MSHTPFADPASFSLRQHLTETDIGPAEMYALALVYFADPDAVDVLCEHATGSFRLLVGLYAAQEHVMAYYLVVASQHDRWRFRDQVLSCVVDRVCCASEADLLEGLCMARTVFPGGSTRTFRHGPQYVSDLFAEHAPLGSLTDRVAAEMSVRFTRYLAPELGLTTRLNPRLRRSFTSSLVDRFVSRFLLSRFGMHTPSWDMFKHLHTPETRVGDVVDLVAAVEQNR